MSLFASHSPFYTALSTNVFLDDDFEDGDLVGWASTADWTNDGGELKHNLDDIEDESSINFPYATALDLTTESYQWSFCVRNGSNWTPSGANNFVVHLNNTDAAFGGDGYAVGVNQTNSTELLTLYRYDAGVPTPIIISSYEWGSGNDVCMTVSRSPSGLWELEYMVLAPTAGTQISGGTVTDTNHTGGTHFGMFFEYTSSRAGLLWMDDVAVQSCPASTSINFAASTVMLNEADGTYNLCVDIASESSVTATMVDVVLISGDSLFIGDFPNETLTFAAGSIAQECTTITITNDSGCNGNQDFTFALQNVMGGMMAELGTQSTFTLSLTDDELVTTEIVQQGFEGTAADTWAVTADPVTYNMNSDIWGVVANTGGVTAPAAGTMFWGIRDLDNATNGGGDFLHNLNFAAIDVSAYDNVTVEFQYNVNEFDNDDDLFYEVSFDGTAQGQVLLFEGNSNASTTGWETVSIPVTAGVGMVALTISAIQDGGGDQAGIDAVRITGTQCACTADAGDLITNPSISDFTVCLGADLEDATGGSISFRADYTAADENDPGILGNEYLFLLANAAGTLVDVSTTGDFDFSAQTTAGVYNVYGLSYATNNTPNTASAYTNAIAGDLDVNDIAQIQADDADVILCLSLEGNDTAGAQVAVTLVNGPEVSAVMGTDPTICGTANGSISITLSSPDAVATDYMVDYENNGTPASVTLTSTESVAASGEFNTLTITGLGAGDYDMLALTVVSTGCSSTATQTLTLSEPGAPVPTIEDSTSPTTCGGNQGAITIGGLTVGLMYSVNYTRDALNISSGPFTANANGDIVIANLVAGIYNAIMVTETVSGCEGGNLNTDLVEPTNPTITPLTSSMICAGDAATYDLTQHEADVTTAAGTFAWFLGDPATTGTAVATPNSVSVSDGEIYFVTFTDGTTGCESTTSITVNVFSDATITLGAVTCTSSMIYDTEFTVTTNTNDVVTVVGTDGVDYTGSLTTADNVDYMLTGIPSNAGLTITVTRENNTCPAVSLDVNINSGPVVFGSPAAGTTGDVIFNLPLVSGVQNTQVCANVTADDFTNMSSFQFSVNWDETIVSFASINDVALTGVASGETMINDGILSLSWFSTDFVSGETQTSSAVLFEICFDLIGNPSNISPLDITDNTLTREASNTSGQIIFGNTNGLLGINSNGVSCCPADAGDLLAVGAQDICEGTDSPIFTADYTAADETNPNPAMPTGLMISEIRIDQLGSDDDEFFEIHGVPGASLDGYTYIVIGNGAGGDGVIENVTDLTGSVIPASGYFVAAMPGFSLGTADLSVGNLNFENGDNVTHLLVQGFTGADGDDLDTDDDGILDATPWTAIVDEIALLETVGSGQLVYSSNTIGPDGTFVPAHVYFSAMSGGFVIGSFDIADESDTPNEANEEPDYIYVWIASQDNSATGGTATDIAAFEVVTSSAPYATTFSGLTAGEYCVSGVSFNGTEADFLAANYTTVQEIADAAMANTACVDVSIADCIALTVTDVMNVTDIVEGDCSDLTAAGTFVVSFNIAGGIAPITINGEDVTDPTFSLGTITGTGTDIDPFVFTSNAVSSATAYSFTVADASTSCSEDVTIEGIKDCDPCTGFEAADDIADITECADETITLTPMGGGKQVAVVPAELFISEYIEGSGNNKCIEIYNGTGAAIDLTAGDYEVDIYANGNTGVTGNIDLDGIIADGDVFVICNTGANSIYTDEADLTTGILSFNGDDAVVLTKASATIDIFGNIGCDPGSQWSDGNTTENMTLVRNVDIYQGVTTAPANTPCDFPTLASEWIGLASNATQLGSHTFSGLTDAIVDYNYYDTDPTAGGETPIATGAELEITDAIVPTDGTATTLYVTAFSTDPVCESDPIEVVITRNALPNSMNASLFECADMDGTADFTLENADATIDTDGGNTVTYYATLENAETGMAALTSPYNATDATTVFARIENASGCIATAELTLSTVDCDVSIADPCSCRDNPANVGTSGNATNQTDGQFNETVSVMGPSGQTWFIEAVVGLFDEASAQPPVAPTAFVTGVGGEILVETPNGDGTSEYTLSGMHIDAQGYSVTVSNGTDVLSINNQCFYPTLAMLSAPTSACLFTAPFTINGEESNGGVEDVAGFVVTDDTGATVQIADGLEITIDPMTLGTGTYTIEFTFDAGEPGMMDITDPGCTQSITQTFEIEETPSQMSCNNNINISVGLDCMSEITPDMILEGNQGCEDDYEVQIMSNIGQNLGNTTTVAMLGNTYNVRVYHLPTNNFCWGSITVEDKADPIFACPITPVQVDCFEDFNIVPAPIATDNCDPSPSVSQVNQVINDSDPCTPTTVTRTFTAIDASGNQSEICIQIIELVAPSAPDFADDITFTCEQYAAYPNITDAAALHPGIFDSDISDEDIDVATSTPNGILLNTGAGLPDIAAGIYCPFGFTSSDDTLATCGNDFKIIRTFTVLNWCTNTLVTTDINGDDNVQIIKIIDNTAPTLVRADFEVSANVFGFSSQPCRSTDFLFPATITDNCNDITSIQIFTPIGEADYINGSNGANGGQIPAPGLELGFHTITYTATDACGNIGSIDVEIEVKDIQSPTPVCDQLTTTTLGSNGLSTVNATTFDDGSNDNCGIDIMDVRRMNDPCSITGNTTFGPSVTFCCADVAQSPVTVEFRVIDYFGNANSCMVQVIVEDNTVPVLISCPSNQSITCDVYSENIQPQLDIDNDSVLDQFGTAAYTDACIPTMTTDYTEDVDNCGNGTITRTFNATDTFGNAGPQCTQTITVTHVSDFVVEFPADMDLVCEAGENPPTDGDFGQPTVFFDDCEMVAISQDDQIFTVEDDACYAIYRTWTAINWCVFDDFGFDAVSENPEADLPGGSLDTDGDKDNRTYKDGLNVGNYPNASSDGYIQHTQIIKVTDNTAPVMTNPGTQDVCITDNDCMTTVNLPEAMATDCSPNVTYTANSDFGVGFGPFINVDAGTYNVVYTAADNCGNVSSVEFQVVVTDCKAPTPYCVGGLIVELGGIDTDGDGEDDAGEVELWASDFNAGSFDNCSDVQVSFTQDVNTINRTYTCDSIGTRPVYLWITDAAGNQDVCLTTVLIESVDNVCGEANPSIAGYIEREDGEGVLLSEVMISGNGSNMDMSNDIGFFEVEDLESGYDYTVVPTKNDDHDLGVSTIDLVFIRRHILNEELLDSPYKIIAADANNNQNVTTADVVEIKRLILTTISEYTNNTSWRFVDKYFEFPNPLNPWETDIPEFHSYNNLDTPVYAADFVGIKIGDVNNSGVINLTDDSGEERSGETLALVADDRKVEAGETFTVPVSLSEGVDILGMQWTLDFDKDALEFIEIQADKYLENADFGLSLLSLGAINHSFVNKTGTKLDKESLLFNITFTAQKDGLLSDWLSIGSTHLKSEAYLSRTEFAEVILDFNNTYEVDNQDATILFQNSPNPFTHGTEIAFYLPQSQNATLTIFDATGKELWKERSDYAAGRNTLQVTESQLNATGILYYRIETGDEVLTRKMIKY